MATEPGAAAAEQAVEAAAHAEPAAKRTRRVTFADEAEVRPLCPHRGEDGVRSLASSMSTAEAVAMYANRQRSDHELQLQESEGCVRMTAPNAKTLGCNSRCNGSCASMWSARPMPLHFSHSVEYVLLLLPCGNQFYHTHPTGCPPGPPAPLYDI